MGALKNPEFAYTPPASCSLHSLAQRGTIHVQLLPKSQLLKQGKISEDFQG